jgi:phage tail-like protein
MAVFRQNPYAAFNFVVRHEEIGIGGFMEVSGLDGENAVIEYREGEDQSGAVGAFVRKQPGLERYPNVTLRRGISGDLVLWNLLRKPIRDADKGPELSTEINPTSPLLTIELQNEKHQVVMTWKLHNAWVSKLSGPSLNAKGNEIAIESVEVVCERIELE